MLGHVWNETGNNYSDAELVRRYRSGDETAFQQLVVRYFLVLKKKAASFVGPDAEADDLFQEALLGLHHAARSYEETGGASFRTYSDICIRNRLISYLRRQRSDKNQANTCRASMEEADSMPSAPESEPENALIHREALARLEQYLRTSLSDTESRVLALYIDGKSYDEIAGALEISRKSCHNAMQRIRKKLRARLAEQD